MMTTTYDEPEKKTAGITVKVSPTFYEAFAAKAAEVGIKPPAVTVVGDVVRLAPDWID